MNATAAKAELHNCECSRFIVQLPSGTEIASVCTAKTKRTFAPGHDAKLKGVLIRAEVAGAKVERLGAGGGVKSPLAWAASFGFGHMVEAGVALAKEKAEAKAARKAARAAKVEVEEDNVAAEESQPGSAKVGRWVYEGTFTHLDGQDVYFTYTDKQGNLKGTDKFTRQA